ncbi:branched-chain amino acid ABC transporter permease [Oceanobacillus piezotolerans]|uniref:Branched-chain amino acid ABC transporter permease n=1 Tax=Oceanobacillus piezotolerans TaxID=2448030 RepID=A0A498D7P8_9BACI|nr:AzlC family ABC transporter permease [Oceanobacillus piezotolerans]RLL45476.1 branched-chain amino acid ABC transporter permease [Oceanobacillus piezotolerans]
MSTWREGAVNGIPIALGYLAVSFSFGILAKNAGLSAMDAVIMSGTSLTSAGQFAGLTLIATSAALMEVIFAQLIINSRYFLMSASLSQRIDPSTPISHRMIMAFGITDEVFGVSTAVKGTLSPFYTYGVMSVAIPGWMLGTFLGAYSGDILPGNMVSALSIALYGMLIAVIIPPAKGDKVLSGIILISMVGSLLFSVIPLLQMISSGVKIIVLTFLIAGIAAYLFPVKEETEHE